MSVLIGSHVDEKDPIGEAAARGAEIVQISLGDPQSWKGPFLDYEGGPRALRRAAADAGLTLVVHAPFVINVASTNNRIRVPSRRLLQKHVDMAAELGAIGVVVHGGHVTAKDDPEAGRANWAKAVDGLDAEVPVLIENTAGGRHAMARSLEAIDRLWTALGGVDSAGKFGLCLDTCHAHGAGLGLDGLVDRVRAITGRIDLVHANDSRDEAGTGADRHANLGQGRADAGAIARIVAAAGAPTVVETPGGAQGQGADIAWLRERI
ncbi:deoxyribonuclease IV [uncultured Propionibacterium sp.]|uniref:deoxyribonuclease IV n=1 Tax=uncultured Propionibacterium sp. TaxID=218066 RepID=UPI00293004DD|nr:deoxyribonuclease IV [uncultured Propionibacterium sp.]